MRLVETKVTYDHLIPGAFGWSDCIQLVRTELQIHDLKYGRIGVSPEDNEPLLTYASGAYQKYSFFYEIKSILLVIHQPRLGFAPKEHRISVDELMEFDQKAKAAYALTQLRDTLLLVPGEKQCQWCKARGVCKAYMKWVGDKVASQFEDVSDFDKLRELQTLTPADIDVIYKSIPMIEGWCKAVSNKAYALGLDGDMPGHKIVAGKLGNRKWADVESAIKALKRMKVRKGDYIIEKFASPSQIEKSLTKKQFEQVADQVTRANGKPVLVRITDKRPAVNAAGAFENLEGNTPT